MSDATIVEALEQHIVEFERVNAHEIYCGGHTTCAMLEAKQECLRVVKDEITKQTARETVENSDAEHF